jgi:hypothetical protein
MYPRYGACSKKLHSKPFLNTLVWIKHGIVSVKPQTPKPYNDFECNFVSGLGYDSSYNSSNSFKKSHCIFQGISDTKNWF